LLFFQIKMKTADTFTDYVKSRSNLKLLKTFAYDKLRKEFQDKHEILSQLIDDNLSELVDQFCKTHGHWTLTAENIGSLNVEVYKKLKLIVKRTFDSMDHPITPVDTLRQSFFDGSQEESNMQTYERSYDFLEEKYLNSWNKA
jgi:hypothetical protein